MTWRVNNISASRKKRQMNSKEMKQRANITVGSCHGRGRVRDEQGGIQGINLSVLLLVHLPNTEYGPLRAF